MYLLILALPLLACITSLLLGRYLGNYYIAILNVLCITVSFFLSFFVFYEVVILGVNCYICLTDWIEVGQLVVNFEFLFDKLSVSLLIVVLIVSSLVQIYSVEYMKNDPHFIRFFSYLSLFTFFMIMLLLSANSVLLFWGWEGVGLSSFLLINFWFMRVEANRAALKAIIVNRIGDFTLYLTLVLLYFTFGSFNFFIIFDLTRVVYNNLFDANLFLIHNLSLISLLVLISAMGKSAQLGLHVWLPDAMEGPTPVSALIHAATMVTAGVFLLLRFAPIIQYSSNVLLLTLFVGAATTFMSATIGIVQNDIKKIIAYSTCSQLGYMVFAIGCTNFVGAFFHLFNHAFFKALLFLGAGSVIHALSDEQDIRKMGGLVNLLPLTYSVLFIGTLSLFGFPFLSGFYSKDFILEFAYCSINFMSYFSYWLGVVSTLFTSFYSFRLLFHTFFFTNNFNFTKLKSVGEINLITTSALIILTFLSVFSAYLFFDIFIGTGSPWLLNYDQASYTVLQPMVVEHVPLGIKLMPVLFSFLGLLIALLYFVPKFFFLKKLGFLFIYNRLFKRMYFFFINKWNFDSLYCTTIFKLSLSLFYHSFFKLIDRGLLEWVYLFFIRRYLILYPNFISLNITGYIYVYAYIFFILMIFLFYLYIINSLNLLNIFWVVNFVALFIILLNNKWL